jgi:hypothetical protein
MPVLVGVILALGVSLFATLVGLDRDRAFYSTVTIVVASYYVLFAVMGGSAASVRSEGVVMLLFVVASALGFRRNMWVVAAALCGHGLLDSVHSSLITNPGVPAWWPPFCGAYDVTAGCYLALLLSRSRLTAASGVTRTP